MFPRIALTIDRPVMDELREWPDMLRGIVEAGAHVVVVSADGSDPATASRLLEGIDALVLSGGGDVHPDRYGGSMAGIRATSCIRDAMELALFAEARRRRLHVLGICRGAQLVNVALGGTLYTDLAIDVPRALPHDQPNQRLRHTTHMVQPVPGSVVADWCGTDAAFPVNSAHHQAVAVLAPGCQVAATAPDGVVEAYEYDGRRVVGVQWHPEMDWMVNPTSQALLQAFVRGVRTGRCAEAVS